MQWSLYLFIIVCACIDSVVWGAFQSFFPFASRAVFYATLSKSSSWSAGILAGFLSLIPLFFLTGSLGIDSILLVPLGLLFYAVSRHIELTTFALWGAVFCALILQSFLDTLQASVSFTGITLVAAFLSSTLVLYFYPGSQGNRSSRYHS